MKNTLSLFLLTCLSLNSYAQAAKEITFETKEIGTTVSGQPITGLQAHTDYRIISYNLDTVANDVALVIRKMKDDYFQNKGYMLVYDIANTKIKWLEPITGTQFRYKYFDRDIVNVLPNKKVGYSRETGKMVWEKAIKPGRIEELKKNGASTGVSSIDFEENVITWKNGRVSNPCYEIVYFNDSTILMSAPEGLTCVNINTGNGWSYKIPTYNTNIDAAGTATMNGVGIAMGLLTGFYMVGVVGNNAYHLCSDIIIADRRIYFAGSEHIYCFDDRGYMMWKTALPVKKTAMSYLYVTDSSIMMLNSGLAFNANIINYGKPFLSSYNIQTGEENFLHDIDDMPYVSHHNFTSTNMFLVSGDDLWRYNMSTARISAHKTLPESFTMTGFINPGDYYKQNTNNNYTSLKDLSPTSLYVSTTNKGITRIDENLELRETIAAADVWEIDEKKQGLTIIKNNNKVKLLRKDKLLMETPCNKISIQGTKILLSGNNDLIITDIAQFQ